jgi:hypothetical protein
MIKQYIKLDLLKVRIPFFKNFKIENQIKILFYKEALVDLTGGLQETISLIFKYNKL